jgi:hypothetical protein
VLAVCLAALFSSLNAVAIGIDLSEKHRACSRKANSVFMKRVWFPSLLLKTRERGARYGTMLRHFAQQTRATASM